MATSKAKKGANAIDMRNFRDKTLSHMGTMSGVEMETDFSAIGQRLTSGTGSVSSGSMLPSLHSDQLQVGSFANVLPDSMKEKKKEEEEARG